MFSVPILSAAIFNVHPMKDQYFSALVEEHNMHLQHYIILFRLLVSVVGFYLEHVITLSNIITNLDFGICLCVQRLSIL